MAAESGQGRWYLSKDKKKEMEPFERPRVPGFFEEQ